MGVRSRMGLTSVRVHAYTYPIRLDTTSLGGDEGKVLTTTDVREEASAAMTAEAMESRFDAIDRKRRSAGLRNDLATVVHGFSGPNAP